MSDSASSNGNRVKGSVLIVGGGVGGMQSAFDLAEAGFKVHIVQKDSSIGGTMAMLDKTFPTGDCAMCMISPKMVEVGRHLNIDLITCAEVEKVEGPKGNFRVTIRKNPRYIDEAKCTACGDCARVCPVELPNEYEQGLSTRRATYKEYAQAIPSAYAIRKMDKAPCRLACPAGLNVQGYVQMVGQGKYKEALKIIMQDLPLPGVLGRICPHGCEDACRRCDVDDPIAIRDLKRLAADQFDPREIEIECLPPREEKVAIIGSGPAGLSAAYHLARKGVLSTIFEALPKAGGMLRVGIPEHRLPRDILDREIEVITNLGVEIRTDTPLGPNLTVKTLLNQGYKAIYLATGAHRGIEMGIPGDEAEGVRQGVDFLRELNLKGKAAVGRRVAIVGGGNVAIDASRSAVRLGAEEVTIIYRRTRAEMPAWEEEVEAAEEEGVKISFLSAPQEVLLQDDRVIGLRCIRMELGEPDSSGRRRPVPIPGSEFDMELDQVIPAIGQTPDLSALEEISGLEFSRWGTVETDSITYATNCDGVFAGGDVQTGPWVAIGAVASGREAAESIVRYLDGRDMAEGREPITKEDPVYRPIPKGQHKKDRAKMPELPVEKREGNFKEVELGLDIETGQTEAHRCLNCSYCCECFQCVEACLPGAVTLETHAQQPETMEINVGSIILSPGLARYDAGVRQELGFGRWPNVVSSIQFERILSASGPYQGTVKRPSDGKHPEKIAWIQCVGSRDRHNANPWCSSVCCMYATKQAIIATEHDSRIHPTIFFMELRAFGKDFDKYVDRAKNDYSVRYQRAMISAIREEPGTGNLVLRYAKEDGTLVDETFDMVVLSIGFQPHSDVDDLAKTFDIALNDHRFPRTTQFQPVNTSQDGVFVTGIFQSPKDIPETVMQGSAVAGEAMALLGEARGTETVTRELPPETDITKEEPRIGVFVCHCGINISQTVDVEKVVESVKGEQGVIHAENTMYACAQNTQERIKEIVKEKNLNRVLVASCTPRTHEPLFQDTIREAGLNKYLFELADIREQCSWCHMGQNEDATEKAISIVKMNIAKVRLLEPVTTDSVGVIPGAMVIGGGVAGITAALSLGDQGFDVHLVEKEIDLGGLARNLFHTLDKSDVQGFLKTKIEEIQAHPRITIHTGLEVKSTDGFVGNFKTTLTDGTSFEHGAIIVAIGGTEYESKEYLYGENDRVITQRMLEKRLAANHGVQAGEKYVMIQCVGSREEPDNYCSRICCQDAIKNAIAIKEHSPDTQVIILYRDIRTYGLREDYYFKARDLGVIFVNYIPERKPQVEVSEDNLRVKTFDDMLGREVEFEADWLVLSTGLRPHPTTEEVAKIYKLTRNPEGYLLEAHVKLRPVDFPSEGIFLCGLAHAPKNLDETISQALAAAGRAGVILSQDKLAVSGIISKHNRDICMSCLTCFRVCPFDSPYIDEEGKVSHNEVKCMGCGICAGVCPAKAFQVNNFKDGQILAMIDTLAEGTSM